MKSSSQKLKVRVDELVSLLSKPEKEVIVLLNGLEDGKLRTVDEVSKFLQISTEEVSELNKLGMEKLKPSPSSDLE